MNSPVCRSFPYLRCNYGREVDVWVPPLFIIRVAGLPFCWLNNTSWSYPRFITDNKQAFIQICVDLMCLSILWSDFRESQQNMHVTLFF